jgi:hypothetical protein
MLMLTLDKLRKDGIAPAPWAMKTLELKTFHDYLNGCEVGNAHVWAKINQSAPMLAVRGGNWSMFCHKMQDVILAPYLFEYALQGYDIAEAYFGQTPLLYSMNIFWTQPGTNIYGDTHDWHRDGDDQKQLAMFMYGEDIFRAEDGAHLYQRGTQALFIGDTARSHAEADASLRRDPRSPPAGIVETVLGPAGMMFFTDPSGLHMAPRPAARPRMLAWARWGISPTPEAYRWDGSQPIDKALLGDRYPSDPKLQTAIKLIAS